MNNKKHPAWNRRESLIQCVPELLMRKALWVAAKGLTCCSTELMVRALQVKLIAGPIEADTILVCGQDRFECSPSGFTLHPINEPSFTCGPEIPVL